MNRKTILIITSSIDETATYMITKYSNTTEFYRVDVDCFGEYKFNIDNEGWRISNGKQSICSKNVRSIYYRKPILPSLNEYDPQYHLMIQRDIIAVINGIADSFSGKVLTRPSLLRKSENKVYQLMYASKNKWTIPVSYIGNNSETCKCYEKDLSIIKPLTTGKTYGRNSCEIYQTSMFRGAGEIDITPIYLQRYIEKSFEVRITIVGHSVYPVKIETKNKIDWRADYENHRYTLIDCPNEIIEKCFQMMKDFSLSFGAFDFIVTPENKWVFLEINPNGQWLWLEKCLNLDISQKILEYLKS